jgi:anaerobic ribonucleoside-triphosphate reductase
MRLDELKSWLEAQDEWDYQLDDKGIIIRNERFQTLTHATFEAVEANTLEVLTASCSQGKDVDHITRVTGYFSRTSGWNKGKAGELKDRHRVRVK